MTARGLWRQWPSAGPVLRSLLDDSAGPLQPPLRSEIFGPQRFAQHGRSLGESHRAGRASLRQSAFFPRLKDNARMLRLAQRCIAEQAASGHDISPAALWLLDNFHLIEAQLLAIREGLPRSYFRALPVLLDEPLVGLPRIYGVAWAFVAHTDGAFDEDLLLHFLGAYQAARELSLAEMWALPTTLRVVLVENLRRLAERLATHKAARQLAHLCSDRIASCTVDQLDELLAMLQRRGVAQIFLAQMALRLQGHGAGTSAPPAVLAWLHAALPDAAALHTQQAADQTADNLSVSNAVTSLREIGDADWPDLVGRSSPLMQRMLAWPQFAAEHGRTRDDTLHGIERLAQRSGRSELDVAQALLTLMQAGPQAEVGVTTVASHWLKGPGRPALRRALGLPQGPWTQVLDIGRAIAPRAVLPTYLGAVGLGTLVLMVLLLRPGWGLDAGTFGLALLLLVPASEAVVALLNRLISESTPPSHLPRLALAGGIPPEHRVLVVMPVLLGDPATIDAQVHRLHLHHLASGEREAQYALLSDWPDAQAATMPDDERQLAHAAQGIAALDARWPRSGAAPRFILLHRPRRWSESEQRWIGHERKRGKLEALVAALAGGGQGDFIDLGELSCIAAATPYLLTLDSDTQLPPGRLRELVGVAAHPQNRPRLSADGRRVVGGYGILQPRVVTPLPAPGELTPYYWLFAGQCGIDPYSAASSEVYQDLFGEGSFSGKGLLHVATLHAVLAGRLPEDRVLSHDLLEGALARCAAVSEVTLVEDAPFHADVAAARVHRWMRGDWQLLPFLLRPATWPMHAVNRWKIADNLRRSLVAPLSLALLLLSLAGLGPTPWAVLALLLAAFAAGPALGAVAGFVPGRADVAWRHFTQQAGTELLRALGTGAWHLALLLQHARLATDAVARALWRLGVSRRHLLQWTTAAAAQAAARSTLAGIARQHAATPLLAAMALAGLLWADTPYPTLTLALCLLWAATPLWIWWVSRPLAAAERVLPAVDRAYLQDVARDTWRYFERCVGPDDHHLPPDNLQTLPHEMLAHRTSPTNIGLYLLSVACAQRFGWISTGELLARTAATLDTVDRLQRHRGHLLNWYDTQTCAPLLPMYVSTVDSGNLSGHLLALSQACLELAADTADAGDEVQLRQLARRCEAMAWRPDFAFLYHRRRHLLHIGWRVAEQQLDNGFYDLLASESRLTSLLAIAKGDVPVQHWSALGRPFYALGGRTAMRSWSGSMFEYLMPTLVLTEPPGSVLRQACDAALVEQMDFARAHGVPWGISESAYAGCDHTLAYQYAPQGVPRLALRRTPPDELVVAPYATALAAQIAPRRATRNFAALQALGARGALGFIEAQDFSAARQNEAHGHTPVSTFMAHHQGMTLVALANVLLGGVVQRWGMASPHVEAVASLLHERAPREVSALPQPPPAPPQDVQRRVPALRREVEPGMQAVEPTQLLSNGRYSVALRANGAGCSRLGSTGITRWRDDALRDEWGSFFYLRRGTAAQVVSLSQHPAPDPEAHYQGVFHADRVCLDATWPDLRTRVTAWVCPEDDIEFREVELHNLGTDTLELELISAFEPTLAEPRADEAHPAFGNLFVQARATARGLVFVRRPRLASEQGLWAAHFLAGGDDEVRHLRVQTDRQRWLGRNRSAAAPLAGLRDLPDIDAVGQEKSDGAIQEVASTTLDTGLDPMCALAVRLTLAPQARVRLNFATAATPHEATLRAVIDKYRQGGHVQRSSLMSSTLAGVRGQTLGMSADDLTAVQALTTALLLNLARSGSASVADDGTPIERRRLWRLGLSGERPLILVSAGVTQGLGLIRSLAQALRLWSWGGVACDVVVVNAEPASYLMPLQREIAALRDNHESEPAAAAAELHLLRADELSAAELATLHALACARFQADGRTLAAQVADWIDGHEQALRDRQAVSGTALAPATAGHTPVVPSQGEFDTASGEFRFGVGMARRPVKPWINVLANAEFGSQVSESGGGCTWALNSRLNRLTAWSNDAVADPACEWLLLQDERTHEVWSLAPGAWGEGGLDYRVVHGQGYTAVAHRRGDVEVTVCWCVDAEHSVKQVQVQLLNRGRRRQRLRLLGLVEWMMGGQRSDRTTVHTQVQRNGPQLTLSCTQREGTLGFGGGTAFFVLAAGAGESGPDWTCDRREFFDARGRLQLPDHLGRNQGSGLDPCAALSRRLVLEAGESVECVFLLGYAASPDAARELAAQAASVPAAQRLEQVRRRWDTLLGASEVKTPDPLFDVLVNRWLLYQAVACRLWAKAGFYQAGGATGFRDQLQDSMALAWAAPDMLRAQVLLCASRQFAEGDVQHWWHTPGGAGVRTHFSDDLLWLPFALLHYLRSSADHALLDETRPFLEGVVIPEGAEDAYATPQVSDEQATVYEHAARTIDRSLRVGVHGLPLMGSGDWNDGMNRVGHEGRGESVWLAWFLCLLVADFAPLARARGEDERARRWLDAAAGWQAALNRPEGPVWDGEWYTRAFFDDGQPLGSHRNDEACIDLIAQAWSVLSGVAPPARQRQAMDSVQAHLVDREAGLIRLLHPPLVNAEPSAGYIQAYPPGVRENGGQYAHAGVWALMAQARLGGPDAAAQVWASFTRLSPAHRAAHATQGPRYGVEPYVMAGDVYSAEPYTGRGGWSWYTGAAAWLHRAALESIFGLRLQADVLSFEPCLPPHWPQAELTLRRDDRCMRFLLLRADRPVPVDGPWAGAQALRPGQALRWPELPAETRYVVRAA